MYRFFMALPYPLNTTIPGKYMMLLFTFSSCSICANPSGAGCQSILTIRISTSEIRFFFVIFLKMFRYILPRDGPNIRPSLVSSVFRRMSMTVSGQAIYQEQVFQRPPDIRSDKELGIKFGYKLPLPANLISGPSLIMTNNY